MKKSRIAKFALLGASAAALAATLSTSTYAWYVSNKTANVEAVAGSTASSGAGSSISLSTSGKVSDYHKTISLTDKTAGLNPVVRTGATIASTVAGTTTATYQSLSTSNILSTVTTEGSYYYEYKFYIKADAQCTVRPTITVTNTTPTLPTQINYSGGYVAVDTSTVTEPASGTTYYTYSAGVYTAATNLTAWAANTTYYTASENKVTGADPGADFYVNALNALHMSLGMQTGTAYSNSVTDYVGTATVNEYGAAVAGVTNYMTLTDNSTKPTGASEATAGAQAYYEEITSYELAPAAKALYTETSGLATLNQTFTLAANTPYMMVYHLWLDGADDQCFNACAGQTFSVAFDFTVTAESKS